MIHLGQKWWVPHESSRPHTVTSAEVYLRALALSFPYPNLGFAEEPMMTAGLGGVMGGIHLGFSEKGCVPLCDGWNLSNFEEVKKHFAWSHAM